jgi:hypothetical protein
MREVTGEPRPFPRRGEGAEAAFPRAAERLPGSDHHQP